MYHTYQQKQYDTSSFSLPQFKSSCVLNEWRKKGEIYHTHWQKQYDTSSSSLHHSRAHMFAYFLIFSKTVPSISVYLVQGLAMFQMRYGHWPI